MYIVVKSLLRLTFKYLFKSTVSKDATLYKLNRPEGTTYSWVYKLYVFSHQHVYLLLRANVTTPR